jgi:outer membrane protein TolC
MAAPRSALLVLAIALIGAAVSAQPALRKISRAQALRTGLERNLDLLSKRLDRKRLQVGERAAQKPFSPTLLADLGYRDYYVGSTPPGQSRHLDYSVGASWKSPLGTQLSAEVFADQNVAEASGTPNSGAGIGLGVTQPLLKDGWLDGASLPITEARLNTLIQDESYKTELNKLLLDLESAYWDVALAQSDVDLKTRSLERARSQYEDTKENIRRGILADAEIYLVEENVVIFDQELVRAKQQLLLARRKLAELLAVDADTPFEVEDALIAEPAQALDRDHAVEVGVKSNPRVTAQRLRWDLAQARARYQANQTLPSLGLNAGLALRGWDSNFGTAWGQVFTAPQPDARVGLSFAMPLDRQAVSSDLEAATVEAEKQQAILLKEENAVRFEVENAITELTTNQGLLDLAQKQVELADLKLKAQDAKYKSGLSTLADVVRFQRDVDNAVGAYQRTLRSVKVGKARLLNSQGTLFQTVANSER